MRTHLITTAFILLFALSASGADNATDSQDSNLIKTDGYATMGGSFKLAGSAFLSSRSGEFYETVNEGSSVFGLSAAGDCFIARGFGLGLELTYLTYKFREESYSAINLAFLPTFYFSSPESKEQAGGSFLPYFAFVGELTTGSNFRNLYGFGGELGSDVMLNENMAIDIAFRALWQGSSGWYGDVSGYSLQISTGLAYHLF